MFSTERPSLHSLQINPAISSRKKGAFPGSFLGNFSPRSSCETSQSQKNANTAPDFETVHFDKKSRIQRRFLMSSPKGNFDFNKDRLYGGENATGKSTKKIEKKEKEKSLGKKSEFNSGSPTVCKNLSTLSLFFKRGMIGQRPMTAETNGENKFMGRNINQSKVKDYSSEHLKAKTDTSFAKKSLGASDFLQRPSTNPTGGLRISSTNKNSLNKRRSFQIIQRKSFLPQIPSKNNLNTLENETHTFHSQIDSVLDLDEKSPSKGLGKFQKKPSRASKKITAMLSDQSYYSTPRPMSHFSRSSFLQKNSENKEFFRSIDPDEGKKTLIFKQCVMRVDLFDPNIN